MKFKEKLKTSLIKNKHLIITVTLTFVLVLLLDFTGFNMVFAEELEIEEKPNFTEKAFSFMIRSFAYGIDKLLFRDEKLGIDAIVYNIGNATNGLTLLSKGDLRDFIINFYLSIQYIAAVFFVPLGIWITVDFVKMKNNAQHKVVLKDRLYRWIMTFILLLSMPYFLDVLFQVNGILVEGFKNVGLSFMDKATADTMIEKDQAGFLLEAFKEEAWETKSLTHSIIYLMSVFINGWIVFFYFIRDITISFLFVIYPFLVISYPYEKGMFMNWFKEMLSNIFTQSIHALLFTFTIAMAVTLENNLYNNLFTMTAFASIIPITATAKRLLGLEGNIGAAKSMAGLGTLFGATTLAKTAMGNLKNGGSGIMEGIKDYNSAKVDGATSEKSLPNLNASSLERGNSSKFESRDASSSMGMGDIDNRQREAKRKIIKNAGSMFGGTSIGAMSTLGSSVYGSNAAFYMGAMGTKVGSGVGKVVGSGVGVADSAVDYKMEMNKMYDNDELSEQEITDKYTGLTADALQNTEFKEQEEKAILAKKKMVALGLNDGVFFSANHAYNKLAPKRLSSEEIKNVKGASLYQDKNQSVLYKQNEDGSRAVLGMWGGNSELGDKRVQSKVSFSQNGEMKLSDTRLSQLKDEAKRNVDNMDLTREPNYEEMFNSEYEKDLSVGEKTWQRESMDFAKNEVQFDPEYISKLDSLNRYEEETKSLYEMAKYESLLSEGFDPTISRSQAREYSKNIIKSDDGYLDRKRELDNTYSARTSEIQQSKYNELKTMGLEDVRTNAENKTKNKIRQNLVSKEFSSLQAQEINKMASLRDTTGLNNLVLDSGYSPINDYITPDEQIGIVANKSISELQPANISESFGEIQDGMGYFYEGQNGRTYFAKDELTGQSKLIGFDIGNYDCGTNTCNYGAVKYENGNAYIDEVKYAINGNEFEHAPIEQIVDFNSSVISPEIRSNIQPNTDLIMVTQKDEGVNSGAYHIINAKTGEFMGQQAIPQEYIDSENNGYSRHISVNSLGDYNQHYYGQMTDRDAHMIYNADYPIYNGTKDLSTRGQAIQVAQNIQNISNEKAQLQEYLRGMENYYSGSTIND